MESTAESSTFRWKWLAVVPLVLVVGWLGYRWVSPAYDPPVQPVPNGYDELIALSEKLHRRTGWYDQMPDQELATVVAANEPVLEEARESLRKECLVALNWQADPKWFGDVHLDKNISSLRNVSRGFVAEGMHAIKENNARLAINCGLENLRLARAVSYGGLGTDWLTGAVVYRIGLMTLRDACPSANLEDCKFVFNNLPDISEQFEPPAEITEREWHFFRRVNGAYTTFLTEMTFSNNRAEFEERLAQSRRNVMALNDLLRIHYAIRAFQLTENRLPKTLDELTGRELKEIPRDPFSENDFVYLPGKDRYILFSVGPNGVDDGGIENVQDPKQGDLMLEPRESRDTETSPSN